MQKDPSIRYSILDPTGNITALVEGMPDVEKRPEIASELMRRHPEVEQVGFVRSAAPGAPVRAELCMAGGEFCGNASMCAAALTLLREGAADADETVLLRVSGASAPVTVRLCPEGANAFRTEVRMPPALSIGETELRFGALCAVLPLIRMEGISHLIVEPSSPFFALLSDRAAAEQAVRDFCDALVADGLGMLFLEQGGPALCMTPLVYIPGSGTVFWENSCASGSSAVGMLLAARSGVQTELELSEPGGTLHVKSDPASGETWLCGSVRLTAQSSL